MSLNIKSKINILPKIINSLLVITALLFCLVAFAKGGNNLIINGGVSLANDDNILRTEDQEISDTSLKLSTHLEYLTRYKSQDFQVYYKGNYFKYADHNKFNYEDHHFNINTTVDYSSHLSSLISFDFHSNVEDPNYKNYSSLLTNSFNKYDKKTFKTQAYYGKKNSIGQIILRYKYDTRDFTNNAQSYRNNQQNEYAAAFYYRIAPKTRILIEGKYQNYNYTNKKEINGFDFDESSVSHSYLTGIEWHSDANFQGAIKIGYQTKEYDNNLLKEYSDFSYSLKGKWKPYRYTSIEIQASKLPLDSTQIDVNGYDRDSIYLKVNHEISPRTQISAYYQQDKDELSSIEDDSDRTDKRYNLSTDIQHELLKWVDISFKYKHQTVNSDNYYREFDANVFEFSLMAQFN